MSDGPSAISSRWKLLYNQPAVIVGLVYVNLPFLVLPLYATLEKFDKSYLEASLDLGAGQLAHVLFPCSYLWPCRESSPEQF